jgi:hypothetical protein
MPASLPQPRIAARHTAKGQQRAEQTCGVIYASRPTRGFVISLPIHRAEQRRSGRQLRPMAQEPEVDNCISNPKSSASHVANALHFRG